MLYRIIATKERVMTNRIVTTAKFKFMLAKKRKSIFAVIQRKNRSYNILPLDLHITIKIKLVLLISISSGNGFLFMTLGSIGYPYPSVTVSFANGFNTLFSGYAPIDGFFVIDVGIGISSAGSEFSNGFSSGGGVLSIVGSACLNSIPRR